MTNTRTGGIKVTISGKSYEAACNPQVSEVPREESWPEPTRVKRGRGWTYTYHVTPEQAELIRTHMLDVGDSFANYSDDPDTRAEGRALLRDAARIGNG